MLLSEVVATSAAISAIGGRGEKAATLAALLARLAPGEVAIGVAYLSSQLRQRQIGVGYATLRDLPPPANDATLNLVEVDAALAAVGQVSGRDSQIERRRLLEALFARATAAEQSFLLRLITGELRQGALEGLMQEAIARRLGVPLAEVRRAAMLRGDLGVVAETGVREGAAGLAAFRLQVGQPVLPMLAQSAPTVGDALARISPAAIEWKLDGARVQIHIQPTAVRIFTRSLDDITARLPELVELAQTLPVHTAVLDAEALALKDNGRPQAFQVSASRLGSRLDVERLRRALPLETFVFDILHLDGEDLIDRPASDRHAILAATVPEQWRVPRIVTSDPAVADRFVADTLARGHEGVVVKSLAAPYEAGRRGAGWIKVKPTVTLDLVILAAEWGHGRRRGWLSNLHLGARDPQSGTFVMLGKTFKGLTDEMLRWQTQRLLELEEHRDQWTVYVRPEVVAEIAFDGVQRSSRYPGGVTLRFARVVRYREDKQPADADTLQTIQTLAS